MYEMISDNLLPIVVDEVTGNFDEASAWIAASSMHNFARIRQIGLRKLVQVAFQEFIFSRKRGLLFCRSICDSPVPVEMDSLTCCRVESEDEVLQLGAFSGMYSIEEMKEWIRRGKFLFVARFEGVPVAFQCLSPYSRTRMPYSRFPLSEGQVWVIDTYTLPAYRRRGIASALRQFRNWYLARHGVSEVVNAVGVRNIASLRYGLKIPYRSVQYFHYTRLLWMQRLTVSDGEPVISRLHIRQQPTNPSP